MTRILIVDDDQDWLDLIGGSLPGHEVDTARSYNEAMEAIESGTAYDVAIVELNLIDSPERTMDAQGGRILVFLRDNYPSVRRIALTANSSSSVKRVFDQYVVDDLLLKGNMALAVVPEVVQAALAGTSAEIPPGIRAQRSELRQDFDSWRQDRARRFERQLTNLRNELAGYSLQPGGDALRLASIQDQLAALAAQQADFDQSCSRVGDLLASIVSEEQIYLVQLSVAELKHRFDVDNAAESRLIPEQMTDRRDRRVAGKGNQHDGPRLGINNLARVDQAEVRIQIFLEDASAAPLVEASLRELLYEAGVAELRPSRPEIGSWYRSFTGLLKRATDSDAAAEARRAVELQVLDRFQAGIDGVTGEAVAKLITALGDTANAAIQVGSVLLLKVDDTIIVRHLTGREMAHWQRNPGLFKDPAGALAELQRVAGTEASPSPLATRLLPDGP